MRVFLKNKLKFNHLLVRNIWLKDDSVHFSPQSTYNVIPSGNLIGDIGHIIFDVIPWIFLGNSDDDWGPIINFFIE